MAREVSADRLAALAGDDGTPKRVRLDTGTPSQARVTMTIAIECAGGDRLTVNDIRNWLDRIDAETMPATDEAAGAATVIVTRPQFALQASPRGAITRIEAEIPTP